MPPDVKVAQRVWLTWSVSASITNVRGVGCRMRMKSA
jgi:hypothetical protein